MTLASYLAAKPFHVGILRLNVQEGDVVQYDPGSNEFRYGAQTGVVPQIQALVEMGMLHVITEKELKERSAQKAATPGKSVEETQRDILNDRMKKAGMNAGVVDMSATSVSRPLEAIRAKENPIEKNREILSTVKIDGKDWPIRATEEKRLECLAKVTEYDSLLRLRRFYQLAGENGFVKAIQDRITELGVPPTGAATVKNDADLEREVAKQQPGPDLEKLTDKGSEPMDKPGKKKAAVKTAAGIKLQKTHTKTMPVNFKAAEKKLAADLAKDQARVPESVGKGKGADAE